MADAAVLSVIFSGAVGITGLGVAALGQRRVAETEKSKLLAASEEEQRKRRESRREDLRAIIDEAAKTAMSIRVAASPEELGDPSAAVGEIRNVVLRAHEQLARLGVRVGPDHELYACYAGVAEALDAWRAARARLSGVHEGVAKERLAADEKRAAENCRQALERFLRAATGELGRWESDAAWEHAPAAEVAR